MPQADLETTMKFLKASVYPYVEAMCALTSEPLPVKGEVTNTQMHRLIRQTLNTVSTKYQREVGFNAALAAVYTPPEGSEA